MEGCGEAFEEGGDSDRGQASGSGKPRPIHRRHPKETKAMVTKKHKSDYRDLMEKLLKDIEEEDIGISLFTTFYQDQEELRFFTPEDREKVLIILKKLADDSKRHKGIIQKVMARVEERYNEN